MRRVLVGAALAAFLVVGCSPEDAGSRPVHEGDPAPAYGARTLAGDSTLLADLDGPVLVNVWATWCVPCRREMPALQRLHEEWRDSITVVGVSVDPPGSEERITDFLDETGVSFAIWRDPAERIIRRFTMVGVPGTFLIDASGTVRRRWVGQFDPLAPESIDAIRSAIVAPGPAG